MTTIAATLTEVASDLQGTMNRDQKIKMHTKVYKFNPNELTYNEGKFIIGFAGDAGQIIELVDFFSYPETYKSPPNIKGSGGIVLTENGRLYHFAHPARWIKVNNKYHAIGSGATTAMGALHAGASAKEAILAASSVDPFTGMGTKVLRF